MHMHVLGFGEEDFSTQAAVTIPENTSRFPRGYEIWKQ